MTEAIVIMSILFFLFFIGVPIAFAMGTTAVFGILIYLNPGQLTNLVNIVYSQGISTTMMVAPLFIIMAEFITNGGLAKDIYRVLARWLRKIPGGLGISNILACSVFAALCGSSPVTTATIGKISVPEMAAQGYDKAFGIGTTVVGGTIGILIPPSLAFIIFGIITETSISKLFIAGVIPGILLTILLAIFVYIRVKINPKLVSARPISNDEPAEEKSGMIKDTLILLPIILLITLVLGSMYMGWVTTTEAGGIGALGAFVIVVAMRRLNLTIFRNVLQESAKTTAMLIFLIFCGLSLSFVLSALGIPQELSDQILSISSNKWITLVLIYVLWIILGCILDPLGMIVITMPFLFPSLMALGFDPLWVGVVSTVTVSIGMITPPIGLNLFVAKGITGESFETIVSGSLPFLIVLILVLIILTLFPQLALYLPSMM